LRASEKLAALGRLSAGLAHELRNPLNTLSVLTYAMLEQAGQGDVPLSDLEVVQSEIRRLNLLVDQFLDFARPRRPRFQRQRLEEVLEETLLLVGPEAGKKKIRLERLWQRTPPVWADGDQLKQVFLNLMLNAVQAMDAGGRLRSSTRLAAGGVVVEIEDTGPGIAPEVLDRLFEPFVTTRAGGTGLGLPISVEAPPAISGEIRMVGRSRAMHDLFKLIGRAAAAETTVLVTGESGTGKELVARAIHDHGHRKNGPFVAINCAAIPENLLESELFGHERGAFTGAETLRAGKFELAHRGTLILDEIGEMAPALQAKLLRVLQARDVTRLGGSTALKLDVRVIILTNADLEAKVAAGTFREDLYYRLNVFRIQVPPLRAREDDVLLLANHFLARERMRQKRSIVGFAPEAEHSLSAHSWPGNVRELENAVAQACLKAKGDRITAADISLGPSSRRDCALAGSDPASALGEALGEFLRVFPGQAYERVERILVEHALDATRGNQVQAARLLGVTRNVIRNRMAKHGVGGLGPAGSRGENRVAQIHP
jgi:DNA-binding NtrC family response regulator